MTRAVTGGSEDEALAVGVCIGLALGLRPGRRRCPRTPYGLTSRENLHRGDAPSRVLGQAREDREVAPEAVTPRVFSHSTRGGGASPIRFLLEPAAMGVGATSRP